MQKLITIKLLVFLCLVGCSDHITTHPIPMGLGGEGGEGGLPDLGGAPGSGGADVEEMPSGGSHAGSGGAGPVPPYQPTCEPFTCGSYTPEGKSSDVLCLDVRPNASNAGNFGGVGCTVTLDGQPFPSFSRGVPAGRLIVWGCDFWFNCYEDL